MRLSRSCLLALLRRTSATTDYGSEPSTGSPQGEPEVAARNLPEVALNTVFTLQICDEKHH